MSKVGIYLRLSDEDRFKRDGEESESIQNQRAMLMRYCTEREWEIYGIYSDEDYSGADSSRPDWNKMLRHCEEGKIDVVLCKSQSRFSRDMEIIEKYIHGKFQQWGVRFIGMVDNADTDVKGNKKARQINGLVNEWYLEDLSENIKSAMHSKRLAGQWVGSFAPYGYKRDPEDKNHLIIDPPAANIVREIFQMYRNGIGYVSIAKNLNARGILNPFLYKQESGSNFKTTTDRCTSRKWTDPTIYQILRREVYTGTLVQSKQKKVSYKSDKRVKLPENDWIKVPDTHEAIIEPELWEAVQRRIQTHSSVSKFSGEVHILSGKVFCAVCKNRMWKMSNQLSKGRYKYYKCKTVKTDSELCHNNNGIRLDVLEEIVLSQINQMLSDYYSPDLITLNDNVKDQVDDQVKALQIEQREIQSHLSVQEDNMAKTYDNLLSGLIKQDMFKIFSEKFNAKVADYKLRLDNIDALLKELTGESEAEKLSRDEILSKYRQIDELNHDIVHEFIDAIYVGPIIKPENQRSIDIKWTFA